MIVKIIFIGFITSIICLVLKEKVPEIAFSLSICACVIIFFLVLPLLKDIIEVFNNFSNYIGLNNSYIALVIKIIGVAYLTELGSSLCIDAGQKAIGTKIELGGKIIIMSMSIPIINEILNTVISIL